MPRVKLVYGPDSVVIVENYTIAGHSYSLAGADMSDKELYPYVIVNRKLFDIIKGQLDNLLPPVNFTSVYVRIDAPQSIRQGSEQTIADVVSGFERTKGRP